MPVLIFDLDRTLVDKSMRTCSLGSGRWQRRGWQLMGGTYWPLGVQDAFHRLVDGGHGEDELTRAGAFRVYRDPAALHASLDELGILWR